MRVLKEPNLILPVHIRPYSRKFRLDNDLFTSTVSTEAEILRCWCRHCVTVLASCRPCFAPLSEDVSLLFFSNCWWCKWIGIKQQNWFGTDTFAFPVSFYFGKWVFSQLWSSERSGNINRVYYTFKKSIYVFIHYNYYKEKLSLPLLVSSRHWNNAEYTLL